ncbi:molybdate transport system substrate-binding protein [Neorhodopirellula lusitana]|uniref:Molybdate transport system substrate-binding protein n=2 Tax=Neorhodopirellula lusitana TaxID=445327 RepID=A0ABY1QH92_9BACT|nr:molybdate transport system substrate-binding protein [Neorhodopirellula lusitana]
MRSNPLLITMTGSLVLLAGILALLRFEDRLANPGSTSSARPLVMYCAASNRDVMEEIRGVYQHEFGRQIEIQYGPSQTLLSSLEISQTGDLFLPADDSYLDIARQKSLIGQVLPIATMRAVVAVRLGNPKSVQDYSDLLRSDLRLVLANPDTAAIGKLTHRILSDQSKWNAAAAAALAQRLTVTEVANDVSVGAADAGIVYDAVLHTYSDLTWIDLPELANAESQVSIGVIASSRQLEAALHFAKYVVSSEHGLRHYRQHGFHVQEAANIPIDSVSRSQHQLTSEPFNKPDGAL